MAYCVSWPTTYSLEQWARPVDQNMSYFANVSEAQLMPLSDTGSDQ